MVARWPQRISTWRCCRRRRYGLAGTGQLYGQVHNAFPSCACSYHLGDDTALGVVPGAQRIAHLFSGSVEPWSKGTHGHLAVPVEQRFDVTSAIIPHSRNAWASATLTPLHQSTRLRTVPRNWSASISDINLPQSMTCWHGFFRTMKLRAYAVTAMRTAASRKPQRVMKRAVDRSCDLEATVNLAVLYGGLPAADARPRIACRRSS